MAFPHTNEVNMLSALEAEAQADAVLHFIRTSPKKGWRAAGRNGGSGSGGGGGGGGGLDPQNACAAASASFSKMRSSGSTSSLVAARPLLLDNSDDGREHSKMPARARASARARARHTPKLDAGHRGGGGGGEGGDLARSAERVRQKKRRLAAQREAEARDRYHEHYRGLQATGDSGLSQLEELINVALNARDRSAARGERRGAALLAAGGRVFEGCTVDIAAERAGAGGGGLGLGSLADGAGPGDVLSAETAALLAALGAGERRFEALVLCGEDEAQYPMPSGTSREQLAQHGDFVLYLVRADLLYRQVSTHELYPTQLGRGAGPGGANAAGADVGRVRVLRPTPASATDADEGAFGPADGEGTGVGEGAGGEGKMVVDWTPQQVGRWLQNVLRLPQYKYAFVDGGVDGTMLLLLQDSDLEHMLQVPLSLHRRMILAAVDRLRARQSYEDDGVDNRQLEQYLAIVERERVVQIAALKAAFDDADERHGGTGTLIVAQLDSVLAALESDRGAGDGGAATPSQAEAGTR
eukprot:g6601.t1